MAVENEWTRDQLEQIQQWLLGKWKQLNPCPKCDEHAVRIGASPGHIVVGSPDGGVRLGESYPCFVLTCTYCGYLQLVSAPISGIAFASKPEGGDNVQ